MNPRKRAEIYRRFRAANPKPTTELKYRTPYELLVAVVLSAQATDKSVNKATEVLFQKYDTPQKMAKLGVAGLEGYIKTIGLYRNKAKNVVELSRMLVEKHGGDVPATREALEELPGVGRKTANVVLGTAFGIASGVVVDTHVQRISRRLDLTRETDPAKIEKDLMKLIPRERWILFSHQLIHHGRALCVARNPKCGECKLEPLCYAKDKK